MTPLIDWAMSQDKRGFLLRLFPDEVDGGWVAECMSLPGCMSQGETEREALENLADAINGVLGLRDLEPSP